MASSKSDLGYQVSNAGHRAGREASDFVREHRDGLKKLTRLGYAIKGVLYAIVGALAIQLAVGAGGAATGSSGALQMVAAQGFGGFLLGAIAVGLFAYAAWKLTQAIIDPEHVGRDKKGMAKRVGFGVSAAIHAFLGVEAVRLITGSSAGQGGQGGAEMIAGKLMSLPGGVFLVGLLGAIVVAVGLYYVYEAWNYDFGERLKWNQMSSRERTWATRLGRAGIAARGVVFAMIGVFFVQAAMSHDASQAGGLGQALSELATSTFGTILLGLAALGLLAYAVWCFAKARYRRIQIPT